MHNAPDRLLAFLDEHNFRTAFWDRRIFHAAFSGETLITMADVDGVLHSVTRGDIFKILESSTSRDARSGESVFRSSQAFKALWDNNSIHISFAEKYSKNVRTLRGLLEEYTQHELIDAALFITPPHTQTLKPHRDQEHTFTIQIAGSKTWEFGSRVAGVENERPSFDATQSITLSAGDVLYVPGGIEHRVRAHDSFSVSIGYGIRPLGTTNILRKALEILERNSVVTGLPCDWTGVESKGDALDRILIEAETLFSRDLLAQALEETETELIKKRSNPRLIGLEELFELDDEDTSTRFTRCSNIKWVSDETPGQLKLILPENIELSLPLNHLPALQFIQSGNHQFSAADLPGEIETSDKVHLLARLLTYGCIRRI